MMVEPQATSSTNIGHHQTKSKIIGSVSSVTNRMNQGQFLMAPTSTSGRLESFRTPRDLSLSTPASAAMKAPKRKFEPIIPSAKVKSKSKSSSVSSVTPVGRDREDKKKKDYKDRKKKFGPGNFQGHGRFRGHTQYIQTQGVTFGEMEVLPIHRIKERYDSKIGIAVKKKKETGQKPYFKEEELDQQHELEADDVIRSMKYYNIDEPKVKPKRCDAQPIIVPFRKRAINVKYEFIKKEIKEEKFLSPFMVQGVRIKQEVKEEIEDDVEKKPHIDNYRLQGDSETPIDLTAFSVSEILQQPSGSMFIMQMPDSLPGHVEAEVESKPSTSQETPTTVPSRRSIPCTLKDLGEGPLGNLEFMASGRVRLNFGNGRVMYLEAGTPSAVRQEVVSVEVNQETHTGCMKVLGDVSAVVICSPDWDSELQYITNKTRSKS